MRTKHTMRALLSLLILAAVIGGFCLYYYSALRFTLAENAVLEGQGITIPVSLNDLQDLSKPAPPPALPVQAMQPHISILVTGLGVDETLTQAAINLPPEIALGFAAHASGQEQWMQRASNHPLLLEISEEPAKHEAGEGEKAHKTQAGDANRVAESKWLLQRSAGYTGVYTDLDIKTLFSLKNMRPFLDSLKARNLLFVHEAAEGEMVDQAAEAVSFPMIEATRKIKQAHSAPDIATLLAEVEQAANESGQALVIMEASPAVIGALQEWIPILSAKGLKIVPINDIVRKIE